MILIILPHQLFDPKYFEEDYEQIILYEHPHYFTSFIYYKKNIKMYRESM